MLVQPGLQRAGALPGGDLGNSTKILSSTRTVGRVQDPSAGQEGVMVRRGGLQVKAAALEDTRKKNENKLKKQTESLDFSQNWLKMHQVNRYLHEFSKISISISRVLVYCYFYHFRLLYLSQEIDFSMTIFK